MSVNKLFEVNNYLCIITLAYYYIIIGTFISFSYYVSSIFVVYIYKLLAVKLTLMEFLTLIVYSSNVNFC